MYVVGLTGGIGSGKSTVANEFTKLGVNLVDADIASRELVKSGAPALEAIGNHFGPTVIQTDGSLNRGALREIVFHDGAEKTWLEQLLHPLIGQRLIQLIAASQSPYCILVSPLLLETSQAQLVDCVLVVDVKESTQLERTLARDGGNQSTVEAIIAAQISRAERLEHADDVFYNEQALNTVAPRVLTLHYKYLKAAGVKQADE
jgi:dephospho-CoA kinase